MMSKNKYLLSGVLALLLALGGCQTSSQSDSGMPGGSDAPLIGGVGVDASPDGSPDECVDGGSEGTSMGPGCS